MHPEVAAALQAYEIEVRDGTERSQKEAFRKLQRKRQLLGGAAIAIAQEGESLPQPRTHPDEQEFAAS